MSDDYIKREDAIKIINSGISIDTDADKRYVNGLFRAIRPVDVAPVRHGRWALDMSGAWCSVCGEYSEGEYRYCPACGARMDGDDNEID